ncbi:MAG: ABC transporter ATP-binding protein [Acidimicrobiia bacterium]|nr:ABC transporter ATP-binding protein [Acidimicrobiia bacterium]MBT8193699.1 ABC transporter ATP-binding protein [Acidimicrobiia bacterium]NNF89362.1 ABC transporter ATP-binding protein [Acidimicrobiia bacterium]NNL13048.1 ABC transporter ATP-binding protein [Acidimicrobiia bacterium]
MTAPAVVCIGLGVRFADTEALASIDLTVAPGELLAVFGPSGSGKTTLLHAIAGFVPVDGGSIEVGGRVVAEPGRSVAPEERRVGVVFQHHALWPHLSAAETVAFPLRFRDIPAAERPIEARRLLERLGIGHLADRRPDQLSGGEQQRVSLARALARRPDVFLFDEPTAHLDAPLRRALLEEIEEQRRRDATAAIYATHDATEALAIADRVLVLRKGRVVQVGPPIEIYEQPVDRWAAEMTGPASVLDAGVVAVAAGRARLTLGGVEREIDCSGIEGGVPLIRPEWVRLGGPFEAVVDGVWYRGARTEYRLDTGAGRLVVSESGRPATDVGDRVGWDVERAHLLPAAGSHPDL